MLRRRLDVAIFCVLSFKSDYHFNLPGLSLKPFSHIELKNNILTQNLSL